MDRHRLVRQSAAACALALLLTACGGGGGEAKQEGDSREHKSSDKKGAPGEDAGDSGDETTSTTTGTPPGGGGDDGDTGDGGSSGDDSAAEPNTAQGAQAAYAAYQTMFERLAVEPDPDDEAIAELTSGDERTHVDDTISGLDSRGQAVEFGTDNRHNIYSVTLNADGSATVRDCFVSDQRVVDESSRKVVRSDPDGGAPNVVTARLVRSDGRWKVNRVTAEPVAANQSCGPDGVIGGGT